MAASWLNHIPFVLGFAQISSKLALVRASVRLVQLVDLAGIPGSLGLAQVDSHVDPPRSGSGVDLVAVEGREIVTVVRGSWTLGPGSWTLGRGSLLGHRRVKRGAHRVGSWHAQPETGAGPLVPSSARMATLIARMADHRGDRRGDRPVGSWPCLLEGSPAPCWGSLAGQNEVLPGVVLALQGELTGKSWGQHPVETCRDGCKGPMNG